MGTAATAPTADPVAPAAPPPAAPPTEPTALSSGAPAPTTSPGPTAPAPSADPLAWLPEKVRVMDDKGALDPMKSLEKVAGQYTALEKRLGTSDFRPNDVKDYKVNLPEGIKADDFDLKVLTDDVEFQADLKAMHDAGFTQKQVDLHVAQMIKLAGQVEAGRQQFSHDDCMDELKKDWPEQKTLEKNQAAAYRAAKAYFNLDHMLKNYGNDPEIVRGLAKIGAELGEDPGIPGAGANAGVPEDILTTMRGQPYLNAKHPEHEATVNRVAAHFKKMYGETVHRPDAVPTR